MASEILYLKSLLALKSMKATSHQDYSEVRPSCGIYNLNCSGYIGWLLREFPSAFLEFWPESGERPLVVDYCNRIHQLDYKPSEYWERIYSVWDIKAGDLVAWKRPISGTFPSGHVMIAADKPGCSHRVGEALLTVIDSTKCPHTDDSRESPVKTGLGFGTVGIGVSKNGTAESYYWRGGLSTDEIRTWVGIARLKKL
jgi:hypothetical protein